MSETFNMKVEFKDLEVLGIVCERLGLRGETGSFRLYSTTETGLGIYLPGWKYPAVVRDDGSISIDNYNGRWGDIAELNKLKQVYGVEKAKREARLQGYSVFESVEPNGDIKLTVRVG